MVDWSPGSMTGDYSKVRYRVPETSVVVAKAINYLIKNGLTDYSRCMIIGHSFGKLRYLGTASLGLNGTSKLFIQVDK